jgi:hypothetical protein
VTSLVVHVHELSLVEILCDHPEITSAVTDQSHLLERQIRRILSKVRQNVSTFIQSLVDHRLDDMAGSSRLSMSSQTHQAHHKPQEVCLLKAPFKSSQMNKWDQLFSNDWIEDLLNDNSELLIYLSELRDDVYHIFESSEPESTQHQVFTINEMSLDDLWEEVIKPYYVNEVRREIHQARAVDITTDVTRCFEQLIDAKRPRDQRIGSFWISEEHPELITVIFLTRDGRLLAQRDVSWDPQEPESIIDAFEQIRIRTLTYPNELSQRYPVALELLDQIYTLKASSSIALDDDQTPPNLTKSAYSALCIGQRYVAPLRFWIRADLTELTRHLIPPLALACLEYSEDLERLSERLRDHCSERWLELRRRRAQRQKEHKKPSDTSNVYVRGQRVEVRIVDQIEYYIDVVTLQDHRPGRIKVTPTDQRNHPFFFQTLEPQIGLTIMATVLGEHPTTGDLTLTLEQGPLTPDSISTLEMNDGAEDHSDDNHQSGGSISSGQETLDRLNSLFSTSSPDHDTAHHSKASLDKSDPLSQVSVSYRSY